jgi:phage shock protein A
MSKDEETLIKEALSKEDVGEEVKEAKSEIDAAGDEDEGVEGDFEVTKEEMSIIRAELACEFPEDYTYLR